jgi:hypothetical protein
MYLWNGHEPFIDGDFDSGTSSPGAAPPFHAVVGCR